MSLLCLDVRNHHTEVGLFDAASLDATTSVEPSAHWRVGSDAGRTADEWHVLLDGLLRGCELEPVDGVVVSCTVPAVLAEVRAMLARRFADLPQHVVGPGVRTGVRILTDNPREVGSDRVVNALAAATFHPGPAIVVDLGTATTFDVVDAQGAYVGGAIAPGVGISLDALARGGAQLRAVEVARPRHVVARNTVEAMQSGLVHGFAGLVDGIVTRMRDELAVDDLTVVATGRWASEVAGGCATVTVHDPWLTLNGLRLVSTLTI
ncbi:MAG: type III pantothenate kinase [Nocardioidaceae bacterium]|nr:type III pantothenate kinase [Nocardioidaceae bacterium]